MAGIYIHIPYCKKLCHYCDFYHVIPQDTNTGLVEALLLEAGQRKSYLGAEPVTTIYVGGGTPSVLGISELAMLIEGIKKILNAEGAEEITFEINPDDVTPEYLKGLHNTGINRLSFGVQSFRDEDLKLLNRRHNAKQALDAIENSGRAGFENVTIDLIYGIPGMNAEALTANLNLAFSTGIKHLSAYHLTIEPGTVFGKMKEKGLLEETDEEESTAQFSVLVEKAEKQGFIHYEISNFGKRGFFSQHNSNYWKQVPYIGLGPSAHSFNGFSRQWNIRDVKKYIRLVNSSKPYFESEELDHRTKFNEYILTSLRTMWGIDLDYIEKMFEKEGYDYVQNLSGKFISYGLMHREKNTLVLTNQGKMISDNIISEFMMPPAG
jgi:oxygen-independent coproporphyrinogen-3 oxidase